MKNAFLVICILVFQLMPSYILANEAKKGDVVMIANGDHDTFIKVSEEELKPITDELGIEIGGVKIVDLDYLNNLIGKFEPLKKSFGGSAADSGYILSSLGKNNGIYVVLSDEELSQGFIKNLEDAGMSNYGAYISKENRGEESVMTQLAAFITNSKTHKSERTFIAYKGLCADFTHVKFDLSHIKDYKILYIEGYVFSPKSRDVIFEAIKEAKKHNVKVLFSPSDASFINMYKEDYEKIISQSDIVFTNYREIKALYGKDELETGADKLAKAVEIVIVTNGNNGSTIFSNHGKHKVKIHEALNQAKAIDTTGAGDGYLAGFLYGYLNGFDMHKSGRIGAIIANHVVQEISGRPSKDMLDRIKEAISALDAE